MQNDLNKRLPSAEHKRLAAGGDAHTDTHSEKQDGRELIKNISTLEEYNDLTTSYGHDPEEPQDHTNAEEPQDRDKHFHNEHKKPAPEETEKKADRD